MLRFKACAPLQETIGSTEENWDSAFKKSWTISDLTDCIYSYAITHVVELLTAEGVQHGIRFSTAVAWCRVQACWSVSCRCIGMDHRFACTMSQQVSCR